MHILRAQLNGVTWPEWHEIFPAKNNKWVKNQSNLIQTRWTDSPKDANFTLQWFLQKKSISPCTWLPISLSIVHNDLYPNFKTLFSLSAPWKKLQIEAICPFHPCFRPIMADVEQYSPTPPQTMCEKGLFFSPFSASLHTSTCMSACALPVLHILMWTRKDLSFICACTMDLLVFSKIWLTHTHTHKIHMHESLRMCISRCVCVF